MIKNPWFLTINIIKDWYFPLVTVSVGPIYKRRAPANSILKQDGLVLAGLVWINSIEIIRWINSELIQDFFTWIIPIIPRKIHMCVYCNGCKEFISYTSCRYLVLPLNDSTPFSTSRPVGWVVLYGCCKPELLLDKLLSLWRSSSRAMLHCREHWIHPTPQS